MNKLRLFYTAFLLLAVGCQAESETATAVQPQLNSERIQAKFGSYGVDVLASGDGFRVSNLYSLDGDAKVCRTLAIVQFADDMPAELAATHQAIQDGGSLGATLKRDGWELTKEHAILTDVDMPKLFRTIGRSTSDLTPLATSVYEIHVTREDRDFHYATIVEMHHPEYLDLEQLKELESISDRADRDRAQGLLTLVHEILEQVE